MVRDDGTVQICFELTADQMEDLWYAAKKNYLENSWRMLIRKYVSQR